MAYGSTSGGLVRRLPFLKKCGSDHTELAGNLVESWWLSLFGP